MNKKPSTSWESSHDWYNQTVGKIGHYYHEHIVLPNALRLLHLHKEETLLDIACGQGVLARALPLIKRYVGLDISQGLIDKAKSYTYPQEVSFYVHDVTLPFPDTLGTFDKACILLALQNIEKAEAVIAHAASHLKKGGSFLLVLNHPCFRIPRQSGWTIDAGKKLQSRRVDRYMEPLSIPIATHPSQKESSPTTWSFHHPLSYYFSLLAQNKFTVSALEEWISDKKSTGKMASMEDRARKEFPLFVAILAKLS